MSDDTLVYANPNPSPGAKYQLCLVFLFTTHHTSHTELEKSACWFPKQDNFFPKIIHSEKYMKVINRCNFKKKSCNKSLV